MDPTVFYTVLSGVLTFVLCETLLKLVIEPVQEMRRTLGQVAHVLIERATFIGNPGLQNEEKIHSVSDEIRALSARLQSHLYLIPLYPFTSWVFRLPSRNVVLECSRNLIGLSNGLYSDREGKTIEANGKRVDRIRDALSIHHSEADRWPEKVQ